MAKRCETFDHTADVGLKADADTLEELFEALAEGLAELICPRAPVRPREARPVAAAAEDLEALAVDFLCEVMNAIQAGRFAVAACRVARADEHAVEAELVGEPLDLDRHEIATEVKAVTYHLLKVARDGSRWTGRVVLDV